MQLLENRYFDLKILKKYFNLEFFFVNSRKKINYQVKIGRQICLIVAQIPYYIDLFLVKIKVSEKGR